MKLDKSQITSTKIQINPKFQYPMTKTAKYTMTYIDSTVCDRLSSA